LKKSIYISKWNLQILNFHFKLKKFWIFFFLFHFFILSVVVFQCVAVKIISLISNSTKRKKSIMIIFFGSLDCDIRCTILCEVHFELNIYPFDTYFLGFERLKFRFQFFISLLRSFSNIFEYNATILGSLKKNYHFDFEKSPL